MRRSTAITAQKTILITDDDPTHRDLLREVLAPPLGFILLSAPDGPAPSLRWYSTGTPDSSCSTYPWPAWTGGRWPRRCARAATIRRVS